MSKIDLQNKNFNELKDVILEKIKQKIPSPKEKFGEDIIIQPFFSYVDYQTTLDGNYYMDGKRFPCIVLTGLETGSIHFISVEMLLNGAGQGSYDKT
jgi:hypothetical protein